MVRKATTIQELFAVLLIIGVDYFNLNH